MSRDKLTCIYPVVYGNPPASEDCGYEAPDSELAGRSRLVALQEHLRDTHLQCDTATLQANLRRSNRRVTYAQQTWTQLDPAWHEQEYDKIEWVLPGGTRWLRAEKQP